MKDIFIRSLHYFPGILAAAVLLVSCSTSPDLGEPPPDSVCSSIVDSRCTRCHYKTRICDALGTKSVRQWHKTIKFMIKQGAQLNEDEQIKVIACLSSLPAGSEVVCR